VLTTLVVVALFFGVQKLIPPADATES